jgi:imidazolonepropionase-like amidohydrolase
MTRTSVRYAFIVVAFVGSAAAIALLPARAQTPAMRLPAALVGARVIDGTGRPAIEQAAIVIGPDGRIQAIGPAGSVQVPSGATRVDVSGKTIMPGMINAHAHLQYASNLGGPVRDQLARRMRLYADYGVTTAVSLGSTEADELEGIKLRDEQSKGTLDHARVLTSGLVATGRTPDEARRNVDRLAGLKVDVIKLRLDGNANDRARRRWVH